MNAASRFLLSLAILFFTAHAIAASAIEGDYVANGKQAKLAHGLVVAGKPFSGNPTLELIFTEMDASADDNPEMHAMFGNFGSSLVITLMKAADGYSIIGCVFGHQALEHSGASAIGIVSAVDVRESEGRISGQLVTGADADVFGEAVKVDLKFDLKLP
jgi:hypothetical protein